MKTKLLVILIGIFSFIGFVGCTPDVDVTNVIITPGGDGSGTQVDKSNSNLLVNIGNPSYGTQSYSKSVRGITRTGEQNPLIHLTGQTVNDLEIGLNYNNNLWKTTYQGPSGTEQVNPTIFLGSTRGYVYATSTVTSPYKNAFAFTKKTNDDGTLTVESVFNPTTGYMSPIPVFFWGNHPLVTSTELLSEFNPNDLSKWTTNIVQKNTRSTAISKNIEYGNSVLQINLSIGNDKEYLIWHSQYKDEGQYRINANADNEEIELTEDIYNDMVSKLNIEPNSSNWPFADFNDYKTKECKSGNNYYHVGYGKTVTIMQKDNTVSKHFIGDSKWDDFNFEVEEIAFTSSGKVVYGADYSYTTYPSTSNEDGTAYYKYDLTTAMGDNSTTYLSTLPTTMEESQIWLHCKVTASPNAESTRFEWKIKESSKDDAPWITIKDGTRFYILGTIKKGTNGPTGTPYKATYQQGVFCPDAVTITPIKITNLNVKGVFAENPPYDTVNSNLFYNFDTEYGSMDGIWEIDK